jgi:UDP-N-acetylmuramoylalanine--D-glutamate ligase
LTGQRVAILGAGRSGVAVAEATKKLGGIPTLYDQKPSEQLPSASHIQEVGISLVDGFTGSLTTSDCDLLITSPGVDSRSPLLQGALASGVEVIGEIEFAYRISKAPIIAITGTNGKSTTTLMTWLCLRALGKDALLCGNIYGSGYEEVPLTEAAAAGTESQVLVAEISSFQLEWVNEFRPRCAAITNITPDHLNRYDAFEQYAATKHRIYRNMGEGDVYVHHPDPATSPKTPHGSFTELTTQIDTDRIVFGDKSIALCELPFGERHNVQNAAMAGLLALSFVEPPQEPLKFSTHSLNKVELALIGFGGLDHRMERIGSRNSVDLINNSMCTNPGALIASSRSLDSHQHLLIGGLTKDLDFAPVADYLRESGNSAYLFGADAAKINSQLGGSFPVFRTMEEAFAAAIRAARPGDAVMLAPGCASMDQFTDFRARGDEFKRLAKEWLQHDQIATH